MEEKRIEMELKALGGLTQQEQEEFLSLFSKYTNLLKGNSSAL